MSDLSDKTREELVCACTRLAMLRRYPATSHDDVFATACVVLKAEIARRDAAIDDERASDVYAAAERALCALRDVNLLTDTAECVRAAINAARAVIERPRTAPPTVGTTTAPVTLGSAAAFVDALVGETRAGAKSPHAKSFLSGVLGGELTLAGTDTTRVREFCRYLRGAALALDRECDATEQRQWEQIVRADQQRAAQPLTAPLTGGSYVVLPNSNAVGVCLHANITTDTRGTVCTDCGCVLTNLAGVSGSTSSPLCGSTHASTVVLSDGTRQCLNCGVVIP